MIKTWEFEFLYDVIETYKKNGKRLEIIENNLEKTWNIWYKSWQIKEILVHRSDIHWSNTYCYYNCKYSNTKRGQSGLGCLVWRWQLMLTSPHINTL